MSIINHGPWYNYWTETNINLHICIYFWLFPISFYLGDKILLSILWKFNGKNVVTLNNHLVWYILLLIDLNDTLFSFILSLEIFLHYSNIYNIWISLILGFYGIFIFIYITRCICFRTYNIIIYWLVVINNYVQLVLIKIVCL